ncbi:bromodomain-containing protein 8 [Wyeomyia smithii]|uniref:bromodomain-containing protein 8 n=1 Tax=Wyeomyia smithii TaxID=174621 RepID=UPI0024681262|nr:bromodomain-containing protein 8 [Wyeomyia smithii]
MSNISSIQERLQLKRVPLDKWSTKEKLCLASAVACSGDQNWMSVSRSLKMLCGANRPVDWFSQKSCAAQYGKLLENVETPKRKKRTASERDGVIAVETPGESILRKLSQERIIELKKIIQDEAQQYTKVKEDIILIQSGVTDEKKLREMWKQIELEKAQKEKEQILHAQWLKEREEKKLELERQWRPLYPSSPSSSKVVSGGSFKIKDETDDDSQSSCKSGTSPLLTSLLKSPAATSGNSMLQTSNNKTTLSPTIVNLLSSNSPAMVNIQARNLFPSAAVLGTQSCETGQSISLTTDNTKPEKKETESNLNVTNLDASMQDTFPDKSGAISAPKALPETDPEKTEDMETDSDNVDPAKDLMAVFQELMPEELDEILNENNGILEDEILENVVDSIMEDEVISPKGKDINVVLEAANAISNDDNFDNPKNEEKHKVSQNTNEVVAVTTSSSIVSPKESNNLLNNQEEVTQTNFGQSVKSTEMNNCVERAEDGESSEFGELAKSSETAEPTDLSKLCDAEKHNESVKVEETLENKIAVEKTDDHHQGEQELSKAEEITCVTLDSSSNTTSDSNKEDANASAPSKYDVISEVKPDEEDSEDKPLASLDPVSTENKTLEINSEVLDEKIDDDDSCSSDEKSNVSSVEAKVQETTKTLTEEEEAARAKKEALEKLAAEYDFKDDEEPIVPLSIQKSKEEKHVPEEDIFMNAQEHLDDEPDEKKETDIKIQEDPIVAVTDTDDDSLIEMKISKTKRDYSRRRPIEEPSKVKEDQQTMMKTEESEGRTLRKLRDRARDRDRSESPFVLLEDDMTDKLKRSYSSTPVMDSVPSSPASSEDKDYRVWKKAITSIHSKISSLRYASAFLKPMPEDQTVDIIYRPMDLSTIKRNIENGTIRTTADYQRDVMLVCTNAIMLNRTDLCSPAAARVLLKESVALIEATMESSSKLVRDREPENRVSSVSKRIFRKGTTRSSTSSARN